MRRLLIAAALAVAAIPSAHAGVACYGEASAGKTITSTKLSDDASGPISVSANGLQGGLGIGCDYAIGSAIIGALARYEVMDLKTRLGDGSMGSDAMWTLAMRAGIKINPGTLVYGLAGISGTDLSYPGLSYDATGITYGAGLEIDLATNNLSAFVEWSHTQLDKRHEGPTLLAPETDVIRAGLRIKFDVLK